MDAPYYPSPYIGHSSPRKVVGRWDSFANFRANKGMQGRLEVLGRLVF